MMTVVMMVTARIILTSITIVAMVATVTTLAIIAIHYSYHHSCQEWPGLLKQRSGELDSSALSKPALQRLLGTPPGTAPSLAVLLLRNLN